MSKRKKNIAIPVVMSDNTNLYLSLWIELNNSHEELQFDDIRRKMNFLWQNMNKQEKRIFKQESDKIHIYDKR